ncbi:MAG: methylated-DNA-[protein]-cysteine S-methyltransferase, partial [Hyphomonas sp.]
MGAKLILSGIRLMLEPFGVILPDMTQGADPDRAEAHFHLFDTAIGPCGLAWNSAGLVQVQLPEASEAATETRLGGGASARWTDTLPRSIQNCAGCMRAYFDGEAIDFTDVALDMGRASAFNAQVYTALR